MLEGERKEQLIQAEDAESDSDEPHTLLDLALFRLAAAAEPPRVVMIDFRVYRPEQEPPDNLFALDEQISL